jgi:hypothetical protein
MDAGGRTITEWTKGRKSARLTRRARLMHNVLDESAEHPTTVGAIIWQGHRKPNLEDQS